MSILQLETRALFTATFIALYALHGLHAAGQEKLSLFTVAATPLHMEKNSSLVLETFDLVWAPFTLGFEKSNRKQRDIDLNAPEFRLVVDWSKDKLYFSPVTYKAPFELYITDMKSFETFTLEIEQETHIEGVTFDTHELVLCPKFVAGNCLENGRALSYAESPQFRKVDSKTLSHVDHPSRVLIEENRLVDLVYGGGEFVDIGLAPPAKDSDNAYFYILANRAESLWLLEKSPESAPILWMYSRNEGEWKEAEVKGDASEWYTRHNWIGICVKWHYPESGKYGPIMTGEWIMFNTSNDEPIPLSIQLHHGKKSMFLYGDDERLFFTEEDTLLGYSGSYLRASSIRRGLATELLRDEAVRNLVALDVVGE